MDQFDRNFYSKKHWDATRIIASNLKRARAKKGLSQRKVAKLLEMPGYNSYEYAYSMPSKERLEKLASFYGVKVEDLYKENGVV